MALKSEDKKGKFLGVDYICAVLGVVYEAIDIIEDVYVVRLKSSDVVVFMNSNYSIIGVSKSNCDLEAAVGECKKKYESARISGYLGELSYQELSDISNRVNFVQYGELLINNLYYIVADNNYYVRTLILIKFVLAEVNVYYKHLLPLMIAGGAITDVYSYVLNMISKVWDLVKSNPNITPLEILRALGQKHELGILEKYLNYIIPLFKEGYNREMVSNLLNILTMPHGLEEVAKHIDGRIDKRPYGSFSDLVEYIESDERKTGQGLL